jgi:GxxExxY protein
LNREDAKDAKGNSTDVEAVASVIVDSAIKVHRALGPGLLESAYQACLTHELRSNGLDVECEIPLPVSCGDIYVDAGYRIDMLVNECVVIENKVVERVLPVHTAQVLTYLKLSNHKLGFLLNWHVTLMKHGIKRIVHNL